MKLMQLVTLHEIIGNNYPVLERAVDHFGHESQYGKTIEECAELIDAICKAREGRITREALASEAADVFIMALQVGEMVGMDLFLDELERKTARLAKMMEAAK